MSTLDLKENKTKIIIITVAAIAVITCVIFLAVGLFGGAAPVNAEEADNEDTTTTTAEFNADLIPVTTTKSEEPDIPEETPEPDTSETVTLSPEEDGANAVVDGDGADIIQSIVDEGYDVDTDIIEEEFEEPEVTQVTTTPVTTLDWGDMTGEPTPEGFEDWCGEGGGEAGEVNPDHSWIGN